MEIIISLNDVGLKRFLNSCRQDFHYIYLGGKNYDIEKLLKNRGFKSVDLNFLDEKQKNDFVKSYIDLVGKLGQQHNCLSWWATGTSAKNQFGSKLFENLYLLHIILGIIKQDKIDNLVIINLPPILYNSLISYCDKNKIKYKVLKRGILSSLEKIKSAANYTSNLLFFILLTWKQIYIAKRAFKNKFKKEVEKKENYYVIRTWFYPGTLENKGYIDSFFGVLPSYLIRKGEKLIVIAGVMGEYRPIVKKISGQKDYLIFPLELFLNYLDPVWALAEMLLHRVKIEGEIDFNGIDVSDTIRRELDKEFAGVSPVFNYLNFYCIKRLLSRVKIHNFITIYENNAWERMCILALRKYSPGTFIICYQHPPLSEASVNMMISNHEKDIMPMPDRINTIGKINKKWLEQYGNYNPDLIHESCALRLEEIYSTGPAPRGFSHKILIILGGINNRAIDMINFVHKGMKDLNKYRIEIRPHPALPFQVLSDKLDFNMSKSSLFSISTNQSVIKDLQEADIVLYDASTISLQALNIGIPVIHIVLRDILSFDPLFQCNFLKWTVAKEEELLPTIERIYQLSDEEFQRQQREAQTYIKDYIYPCTEEKLSEFIV